MQGTGNSALFSLTDSRNAVSPLFRVRPENVNRLHHTRGHIAMVNGFPFSRRVRKEGADRGRKPGTGLDEAVHGQQYSNEGPGSLRGTS